MKKYYILAALATIAFFEMLVFLISYLDDEWCPCFWNCFLGWNLLLGTISLMGGFVFLINYLLDKTQSNDNQ